MNYEELTTFLAEAPLYQEKPLENIPRARAVIFETEDGLPRPTQEMPVPKELRRHCSICAGVQTWRWYGIPGSAEWMHIGVNEIDYQCRNCSKEVFQVWILIWLNEGRIFVQKVGQWPKLGITLPADFDKALGQKKPLYFKGMTSRHQGYGIGALTYFRRLIEDTTDEMLNLLERAMIETGAGSEAIEALQEAKGGIRFEDKVKIAAATMPAHLRPGGVNPFGDLYELLSIGLHDLNDDECCDIVDAMDQALKFIYTQLKTHAEDAKAYEAAVKSINATVAKLKGRR